MLDGGLEMYRKYVLSICVGLFCRGGTAPILIPKMLVFPLVCDNVWCSNVFGVFWGAPNVTENIDFSIGF